jgi:26S proteasome regulatory subunit N1
MRMQKMHLAPATLGVGLVAMGEELGTVMATRMLEHLLSYASAEVRAAVPLALAILRPSQPEMHDMDTLSRLTHDSDNGVARAALLGLGVLGAGTNNARLAGVFESAAQHSRWPC